MEEQCVSLTDKGKIFLLEHEVDQLNKAVWILRISIILLSSAFIIHFL